MHLFLDASSIYTPFQLFTPWCILKKGCLMHLFWDTSSIYTPFQLFTPWCILKKGCLMHLFFYASSVLLFNFLYLDASLKKDAWCIFFLCILPTPFQLFIHWCTLKKGCLMHPKKGCMRPFFKCACDGRVRSMSVDWVQQRGLPREFFSIMLIML